MCNGMNQKDVSKRKNIARCGYRCDLCPAFKDNIRSEEDRQKVSDGWFRYYGFRIPPETICCDGCLVEDCNNPHRIDPDCAVRLCAEKRDLPNCAHCDEYICNKLAEKMVNPNKIVKQAGAPVPQEDYIRFIEPYNGRKVLDEISKEVGLSG